MGEGGGPNKLVPQAFMTSLAEEGGRHDEQTLPGLVAACFLAWCGVRRGWKQARQAEIYKRVLSVLWYV